jgi:hypothetical protein
MQFSIMMPLFHPHHVKGDSMKFKHLTFLLCLIIFSHTLLFAQNITPTETQSEKEKTQKELEKLVSEILNQTVSSASSLKLPQNRAVVYAIAGDLYWKFDEKRARQLFRNSGNEILTANIEADSEKKADDLPFPIILNRSNFRSEILLVIAKRDADLALEMLIETRPANIVEGLAKAAQPNTRLESVSVGFNPEQARLSQEIALEQHFITLSAEQNPDKAIKLIKESLAKGISNQMITLLQKINQKDEKKAMDLADEIVKKIIDADLNKKSDELSAAIQIMQFATQQNAQKNTKEKLFRFSETQQKDIANKLANTFMQPGNSLEMTRKFTQIIRILENLIPERTALLKQKQADAMKTLPPEIKRMQQDWNANSTPEEIIAGLPKLNELEKNNSYQLLTIKIAQIEDEARAKKLIEQISDEKAREFITEQYESFKISRAARNGKLDEARKLIGNLTKKKTQIQKLVSLAIDFHKKGGEKDLETSEILMKEASALANEVPEDEDELNDLMEIVKGYTVVNPDQAIRIFEPIVDQINDVIQASAILSKYNKRNQSFKKGELLMRTTGFGSNEILLFRYINQIQMLGKADLNRMNLFADKFQRSDARILVKLFIAQGFLREENKSFPGGAPLVNAGF